MIQWKDIRRILKEGNPEPEQKVVKTEDEWREQLTPEQFKITRQKGTERAFSSEMCHRFDPGKYTCVCCGTLLFDAGEKFESGSGWPSFTQPVNKKVVAYHEDNTFLMHRVEITCNVCDAHLGHVFPDGPEPNGLRYCVNAVSLQKIEEATEKK